MRPIRLAVVCLCALLLGGCARRYQVTFTHGSVLTVRGKPKYDPATDSYIVTDLRGDTGRVKAISIREIAPASRTP